MNFADLTDAITEPHNDGGGFGEKYISLRLKEERISSDTELGQLPNVGPRHPHFAEWMMRKLSCNRLMNYLEKKPGPLSILEVGCGNGWLSYHLARTPDSRVTGIDINTTELGQAKRVFLYRSNLRFVWGDIRSGTLADEKFDIVIFAASMQYFSDLKKTLQYVMHHLLTPRGEIHILDTPFYKLTSLRDARNRTITYYTKLGFPEMINYYNHHSLEELHSFHYKILYDPEAIRHRFIRNRNPFYWFRIISP